MSDLFPAFGVRCAPVSRVADHNREAHHLLAGLDACPFDVHPLQAHFADGRAVRRRDDEQEALLGHRLVDAANVIEGMLGDLVRV